MSYPRGELSKGKRLGTVTSTHAAIDCVLIDVSQEEDAELHRLQNEALKVFVDSDAL